MINAAAYTAVDSAETDTALAFAINGAAPAAMARAAAERGLPLVHLSTDYVFDGAGTAPRRRDDPVGAAERLRREQAGGRAGRARRRRAPCDPAHQPGCSRRTASISSRRCCGWDASGRALSVVGDQIGGPTPADAIAAACLTLARELGGGQARRHLSHFAGAPETSWAGFARAIFARPASGPRSIDIATSRLPDPGAAAAELAAGLQRAGARHGIARPDWRDGLDRVLAELKAQAEA